ncbi:hypothetical protein GC722_03420 [Auraticoccus sp. F435]|uniref:DUF6194 domain-containing protein n=2 Tax=Auraticoccus cholistanensis TaxID=2656650 RepID=A0A6A9UQY8_9ACTN|nr:hypothetical protein [Auraticoccus cholistanensis]
MEQILATVRGLDHVLVLSPTEGSAFPPLAWGDHFFYVSPDGQVPQREQPYATIVTKDYPDDTLCGLDDPDRWRLNIHVGRRALLELTGDDGGDEARSWDYGGSDVLLPHPLYRTQGWVAVVNPGPRTGALALRLLREAHEAAARRSRRRHPEAWHRTSSQ